MFPVFRIDPTSDGTFIFLEFQMFNSGIFLEIGAGIDDKFQMVLAVPLVSLEIDNPAKTILSIKPEIRSILSISQWL